ncbi:MAG: hypothetical protein KDA20_00100 [Phycisphaerales bacterium]|nr:hypothetical protein [Phycisphaerales bacterium]
MSSEIPPYRQRAGAVTIRELTAGLIWPELFRVLGLSVHPARVLMGTLTALVLFGGAWLIQRASDSAGFAALNIIWPTGGPMAVQERFDHIGARWIYSGDTWGVIGAVVWCAIVLVIGGGAVARSAALDFAVDLDPGFRKSVRFAFARLGMLLGAALIPLAVIGALVGLAKLFGLATMTWSPGDAIGGILWFIPMGLSVIAAIVGALYVFGFVMLPGAAACEDTDSGDAIQRVFAYLVSKPHRYVAYGVVLLAQLAIAYWLIQLVVRSGLGVAEDLAAGDFASWGTGAQLDAPPFAARAVAFWIQVAWLIFIGWVMSYLFSGGALLYLLMRRACDEQDIREVRLTPVTLPEKRKPAGDPATAPPASGDGEAASAS